MGEIKRFIYGCGGVGKELLDCMEQHNEKVFGFIDDNPMVKSCFEIPSVTFEDFCSKYDIKEVEVIISMGEPDIRKKVSERLMQYGIKEVGLDYSLYHSKRNVAVGDGTILHIGSMVSTNASIGRSCIINKKAIVAHDCKIGDYSVLSSGVILGGNVTIKDGCFIGMGASIRNGVTIGKNSIIGMGAVVTKNIEEESVAVGNPAAVVKTNDSHRVFLT